MNRFLKLLAIILFPMLVFAVFTETLLRTAPNVYKYKYEWMQENAENVEVLVLGNSYAYLGISPTFFSQKAFNLANVGQDAKQDDFLLHYWGKRYKKLKVVIIPIHYRTWNIGLMEDGNSIYRCRYYKLYMDCPLYGGNPLKYFELSEPRTAFKSLNSILHGRNSTGCDTLGFGALSSSAADEKVAIRDAKEHTASNTEKRSNNYKYISNIASFCKEHDIALLLVTPPMWKFYYDALNTEQLNTMRSKADLVAKDYDALYLDYSESKEFTASDFTDGHHLNEQGAKKFSKILNKEINRVIN